MNTIATKSMKSTKSAAPVSAPHIETISIDEAKLNAMVPKKVLSTSKKEKVPGNMCTCAANCQKKEDGYKAAMKGLPVYIVNGEDGKPHAYRPCSYTCIKDTDVCIRHAKQVEENRTKLSNLEARANDPVDSSVRRVIVKRKGDLIEITDPFFETMGTRRGAAAKKSNEDTTYDFKNRDDVILNILRHGNLRLRDYLYTCAKEILETKQPIQKVASVGTTSYTIQSAPAPAPTQSLRDMMGAEESEDDAETRSCDSEAYEESEKDDDEEEEESDDESESESESESDAEETELTEITTDKGVSYGLDNDGNVYDLTTLDDDEPTCVGTLIEMKKKYSKIQHADKHYTIGKEIEDGERSLILCTLSDKVFDPETKECVGKLKRAKKSGEVKIEYTTKE